ncbi:hypothetical protein [Saccharothrix hoggarensis]|uniref:Uncharacterized protein n=1 Tax=Saccharothrix hoggarensis TaxID=913853 RepID=A0ABW3QY41_9PSEU
MWVLSSPVVWALPVVVGLVLALWEDGPPVETGLSLVIAGLVLKAREAHAAKPGTWFPLLVTGSTTFALALTSGSVGWWVLRIDPSLFELGRFLLGLAVAVGLGVWAWRARSATVAATAAGYLAALWHFRPVPEGASTGVLSYAPPPGPAFQLHVPPYPELVVVAGAVFAYARTDRVRPWHVLAIAGLLGSLAHGGAVALLVVAVVAATHDLNARRPGAWYPLLVVGVGLVVWPVVDRLLPEPVSDPGIANAPGGRNTTGALHAVSTAADSVRDYDELFLAVVVAVGLAVWAWRRKSPIVLLTAAGYFGAAYVATDREAWIAPLVVTLSEPPTQFVVLAGAAVAFATCTAAATATSTSTSRTVGEAFPPGR